MYAPDAFDETRPEALAALIRAHPLGLLISAGPGGLVANPAPFLLEPEAGRFGLLRVHLARANGQWRDLAAAPEALVVFQGPQAYVSPSWYASKRAHGKVVPTWNYMIAQARGRARVVEDADWLRAQVEALTAAREAGRAEPWAVGDAPERFVAAQLRGIVGIEIPVERIVGKWKLSQNRPAEDRAGVAAGLAAAGEALAREMPEA